MLARYEAPLFNSKTGVMNMRVTRGLLILGVAATLGACSTEDLLNVGDLPVNPLLVGDWLTTAATVSDPLGTYADVDLIAAGASMSIEFSPTGTYEMTVDEGSGQEIETGTYRFVELNVIELIPAGETDGDMWTIDLSATNMAVTFDDVFDFDDDGTEEPANWALDLLK